MCHMPVFDRFLLGAMQTDLVRDFVVYSYRWLAASIDKSVFMAYDRTAQHT